MFREGFDGLDFVVLVVPRVEPLVELYGGLLGFTVSADVSTDVSTGVSTDGGAGDGELARVLGLLQPDDVTPHDVTRVVHLQRGSGAGGDLILVESPTCPVGDPVPTPPRIPQRRAGVYALDFYLRDAAATEQALLDGGWSFVSEAVHYDLPGTTIPVRERMLIQQHSGLLHAMVQHRPGGTRSVLSTDGGDENGRCSEVVAVVVLTTDLPGARRFAAGALGGQEYFSGTFAGPAVETMLTYAPGEGLEASLYRGPESRNARLEFARPVDADGRPVALPSGRDQRQVQPGLIVHDLDSVLASWEGEHGRGSTVHEIDWLGGRRRAARFETAYDVSFMLVESQNPPR